MAPPHPAATAPLAGRDDEFLTQDALRAQIHAAGFDVVDEDQVTLEEWDVFEAGFRDRFTRWLEANDAGHPAAEQIRRQYEERRAAYEDGYRGVLGDGLLLPEGIGDTAIARQVLRQTMLWVGRDVSGSPASAPSEGTALNQSHTTEVA